MKRIFRFFTMRYWKDYIRLRHILKCIKNAKKEFIKDRNNTYPIFYGMCKYLGLELFNGNYYFYDRIKDIIPIFTPQFFNKNNSPYCYWWNIYDVQSRINAFDKLINHYEKLIKEL